MSFLDEVVIRTEEAVTARRNARPLESLTACLPERLDDRIFYKALSGPEISIIAEFKRSSPSKKGLAPSDARVQPYVDDYVAGGAHALSILTEEYFFSGNLDDLRAARRQTNRPILRKDFVIDEYQVYEAAEIGVNAVLLIVAVLDDGLLRHLYDLTRSLGLDVLLEIRDKNELVRALALEPDLIGVNNRNLKTRPSSPRDFEMDISRTTRLLREIPDAITVVAESGLKVRSELDELEAAGVRAALIGSALMESEDRVAKCRELILSPSRAELLRRSSQPALA